MVVLLWSLGSLELFIKYNVFTHPLPCYPSPPNMSLGLCYFDCLPLFLLHPGSAHCDEILSEHMSEFKLPDAVADDLIATAFIYLSTWYEVFLHYKGSDPPLFGITGKAHIMLHACLLSRSSPRKPYTHFHYSLDYSIRNLSFPKVL